MHYCIRKTVTLLSDWQIKKPEIGDEETEKKLLLWWKKSHTKWKPSMKIITVITVERTCSVRIFPGILASRETGNFPAKIAFPGIFPGNSTPKKSPLK